MKGSLLGSCIVNRGQNSRCDGQKEKSLYACECDTDQSDQITGETVGKGHIRRQR